MADNETEAWPEDAWKELDSDQISSRDKMGFLSAENQDTMPSKARVPFEPKEWQREEAVVLAAVMAIAGIVAWFVEGRWRAGILWLQMMAGLILAWHFTRLGKMADTEAFLAAGTGYKVPVRKQTRLVHRLGAVLYVLSVPAVIGALMMRFGAFGWRVPDLLWDVAPPALGIIALVLALGAIWRVDETGTTRKSWGTKAHGWALFGVALPLLLSASWVMLLGDIFVNNVPFITTRDVTVFSLILILGVASQMLLAAGLPSIFTVSADARAWRRRRAKRKAKLPPIAAIAGRALAAGLIALALLFGVRTARALGGAETGVQIYVLGAFVVVLIVFFSLAISQFVSASSGKDVKKRVRKPLRGAARAFAWSSPFALGLGILLFMSLTGRITSMGVLGSGHELDRHLIMAFLVVSLGPVGMALRAYQIRVNAIEANLPDFLNDLAETRQAGLTMAGALQTSAMADYGPMTVEVKKMAAQVSWGVSFNEAFRQFAARVPTKLVQRTSYLIIEASRTGGSITEVLKAAARDARQLKGLESERSVSMLTYMIVFYVVFAVFLLIVLVLDHQFIPHVLDAQMAAAEAEGRVSPAIQPEDLTFVYYLAAIIQAVGNGLVGGVLTDGRLSSGLRHVAIMTFLAWLTFTASAAF